MSTSPAERIEKLRAQIYEHDHRYYVLDEPSISDAEYDALLQALRDLEAAHPELIIANSPTQRVGAKASGGFAKVSHSSPMLSLENAFDADDIRDWAGRVARRLPDEHDLSTLRYTIEPKIDGIAVGLRYEAGQFVQAATRGDGHVGEDITANVRTMRSVPLKLRDPKGVIASAGPIDIRGEVFMPLDAFAALNAGLEAEGQATYAHARNTAAGSLRQLDPSITATRELHFWAYALGENSGLDVQGQYDLLTFFRQIGLPTNPDSQRFEDLEEAIAYASDWMLHRDELNYLADGAVFKVDSFRDQALLGAVSHHPRWAIAFKAPAEETTTSIERIEVRVGRTGRLVPHATLVPVQIGGVTVSQATLHNEDYVRERDIRIGDAVVIKRAGDVIPQVLSVIKSLRPAGTVPWAMPTTCPACATPVARVEGEADTFCPNPICPRKVIRRIEHFVGRSAMDIEGLGIKLANLFVEEGLITDVADLYSLRAEDLEGREGFGTKRIENLISAIDATRDRPLRRLLVGLGIRHVGGSVAEALAGAFFSLDRIAAAREESFAEIEGLGPEIASSVRAYFDDAAHQELVEKLRAAGLRLTDPEPDPVDSSAEEDPAAQALAGLSFVITGALPDMSRGEAKALIQAAGGRVVGSVSGKTNYLLAGEKAGSKRTKAEALGVPIIDLAELKTLLAQ